MTEETKKIKVLMIDDDPILIKLYDMSVKSQTDFELLTATNIAEGNDKARQEKPDVILLDLMLGKDSSDNMSELDKNTGFNFLIMLKGDPEIQDIPVVIFSNLDTKQDKDRAHELQAADYLVKSEHSPQELLAILKGVVDIARTEKKIREVQDKLS